MNGPRAYLLVLSEGEAIRWVVTQSRTAFPPNRRRQAAQLAPEDRLLLYSARGAFHNPTADRGRIFGEARVCEEVLDFPTAVTVAGREFTSGCRLEIVSLAPYRHGLELAPLVERLAAFPDRRSWPVRMRRALVPLPGADADLLRTELRRHAVNRPGFVGGGGY